MLNNESDSTLDENTMASHHLTYHPFTYTASEIRIFIGAFECQKRFQYSTTKECDLIGFLKAANESCGSLPDLLEIRYNNIHWQKVQLMSHGSQGHVSLWY